MTSDGPDRAALEAVIASDPYDVDAYLVYADWLQRRGDRRGELIALQLAAEREGFTTAAADAAGAHLARHADELLGPLAAHAGVPPDPLRWRWRFGFIHQAHLHRGRLDEILDQLLGHPSGRLLTELSVDADDRETADAVLDVLARRSPPSLRVLELFVTDKLGDIGAALRALPQLHRLAVTAQSFGLDALDLPALKQAKLVGLGLSSRAVRAIATAAWPRLEKLELRTGSSTAIDDLRPLFQRTDLPALTELSLCGELANIACHELPRSALAAQLVHLNLSDGPSQADVRALFEEIGRFERLFSVEIPDECLAAAAGFHARYAIGGVSPLPWLGIDYRLSGRRFSQAHLEAHLEDGRWSNLADDLHACMISPWLTANSACLAVRPGQVETVRAVLEAQPTRDPARGESASPRAFFRLCRRETLRFADSWWLPAQIYAYLPAEHPDGTPAWYVELHQGDARYCYAGFAAIYRTLVALAPSLADAHVFVSHGRIQRMMDEFRLRDGAVWWERRDEEGREWVDFRPEYLVLRARQERDDEVADRMRRLASLIHLDAANDQLRLQHPREAAAELAKARRIYPDSKELLELEAALELELGDSQLVAPKLAQARQTLPLLLRARPV